MTHLPRRFAVLFVLAVLVVTGVQLGLRDAAKDTPAQLVATQGRAPWPGWTFPKPKAPTTTTTVAPTTTTVAPTTTAAPAPTTTKPPTTTTTTRRRTPTPTPTAPPTTAAPAPVVTAPPVQIPAGGLSSAAQSSLLSQVNAVRAQGRSCGGTYYGPAPALSLNGNLISAAQGHAVDMASKNYFSHTGLNGSDPGSRITAAGFRWMAYAENIAAGQSSSEIVGSWFASAGHCANFMSTDVNQIGFGMAQNSSSTYGTYWVADLGRAA